MVESTRRKLGICFFFILKVFLKNLNFFLDRVYASDTLLAA
jgi:hypothetical protein